MGKGLEKLDEAMKQMTLQTAIIQQSSSRNSRLQLTQISRTFSTVLAVFYICYLPFTVQFTFYIYSTYFNHKIDSDAYKTVQTFTLFLFFNNCCLNPIIYSRIHVKIFNCIRGLVGKFNSGGTFRPPRNHRSAAHFDPENDNLFLPDRVV